MKIENTLERDNNWNIKIEDYIGEDKGFTYRINQPPLARREGIILSYGK